MLHEHGNKYCAEESIWEVSGKCLDCEVATLHMDDGTRDIGTSNHNKHDVALPPSFFLLRSIIAYHSPPPNPTQLLPMLTTGLPGVWCACFNQIKWQVFFLITQCRCCLTSPLIFLYMSSCLYPHPPNSPTDPGPITNPSAFCWFPR